MKISVREHIKKNFKGADNSEMRASIESGIESKKEIILPGFGVFFEILWNGSDENGQEYILNTIKKNL